MVDKISGGKLADINRVVCKQFGCALPAEFEYYGKSGKRGLKVFAHSGEFLPNVSSVWVGVHFGTLTDGVFTPSIEGAGFLGSKAEKNVVEISETNARKYFSGDDIAVDAAVEGVVLLKSENNCFAPARVSNRYLRAKDRSIYAKVQNTIDNAFTTALKDGVFCAFSHKVAENILPDSRKSTA